MRQRSDGLPATIGFRVKTGRAIAVLLAGPVDAPRVMQRREVVLWDPRVPESRQPYHAALELPPQRGAEVVQRLSDAARAVAVAVVRDLATELRGARHALRGVGLVVSSDSDPQKLGNPHVRAHAAEGRLFREILEAGAKACHVPSRVIVERDIYVTAVSVLGRSSTVITKTLADLGSAVGRPWRAEEKTATLAAWMVLLG